MRTASRSPVTLKIKFKSSTLEQFIERYSVDISHGGIFIRTKDPLPVGTNLKFEFQLKDASPLIVGDGTVVWTRDFDPTRSGVAPGMGVRFDRLPSESQEVLDRILAHKSAKAGKPEAAFLDVPTKVAFRDVPTVVTPKEVLEGLAQSEPRRTLLGVGNNKAAGKSDDQTPLPPPQPFHTDLDDFPDEAFEEATKVAALEALARKSAQIEEQTPFGTSAAEDLAAERRRSVSSRPPRAAGGARESGPVAVVSAVTPSAPARIFHDLPTRSPFAGKAAEAVVDEDAGRVLPHADPFSLPGGGHDSDDGGKAARPAHRLHIVPSPAESGDHAAEPDEAPAAEEHDFEPARARPRRTWIAVAAAVLVVGAGGAWLLSGEDRTAKTKAPAPSAATASAGQRPGQASEAASPVAPAPSPGASDPAAAAGLEVTIKTVPDGATAELVGGSQSGPTPMTFRGLAEGQRYQVKLSMPGFQAAELTIEPESGDPKPVELETKPAVLRVTSEPAGAQVWINGRRHRSLTPADVRLSRRTAQSTSLRLALRKAGFSTAEQEVALDGMVDQGDTMVQEVALVLSRRQAQTESGRGASPERTADAGAPEAPPAGATEPEANETTAEADAAEPAPQPSEPSLVRPDPIPDWMKP
jgi:uncharacterized protein (TIGR02266 family)